ncbi:MAG: site-specific DNA-methyltransferase, partial [Magnetococcales bacterium]|nr:site-specific DNA-methyltransferase [Magnetococcales bacterium]
EVFPCWSDGFAGCWTWDKNRVRQNLDWLVARLVRGRWKIYRKSYANGAERMLKTVLIDPSFYTERGQSAFNALFDTKTKIFQSPKSPYLLMQLLQTATEGDDWVIDFFAGSGTTAQAVLELNQQDGGNRRFILVQLPEATGHPEYPTIAEITKERLRRVIKRLNTDNSSQQDRGFRVFKLDRGEMT